MMKNIRKVEKVTNISTAEWPVMIAIAQLSYWISKLN